MGLFVGWEDRWKVRKSIEKRLDKTFSEYIRKSETQDGWGKCVSCGVLKSYEDLDCGHFVNRRWRATRWHEDNCHIQCRTCNRFNEGNGPGYTLFMVDKYGRGHVDYLLALSRETARFTDYEGEQMILLYRNKLKELAT